VRRASLSVFDGDDDDDDDGNDGEMTIGDLGGTYIHASLVITAWLQCGGERDQDDASGPFRLIELTRWCGEETRHSECVERIYHDDIVFDGHKSYMYISRCLGTVQSINQSKSMHTLFLATAPRDHNIILTQPIRQLLRIWSLTKYATSNTVFMLMRLYHSQGCVNFNSSNYPELYLSRSSI
jgi:hypothetical protein